MSSVINIRECESSCGNEIHVCVSEGERGPQGLQGEKGEQGERGERGYSVSGATIRQLDEHLVLTLQDGTKIDAGELPKRVAQVAATYMLDGVTKVFTLDTSKVNPDYVCCLIINGVTYLEGWNITDNKLALEFDSDKIPSGTMYVVVNMPCFIDGIETASIPESEIIEILEEE